MPTLTIHRDGKTVCVDFTGTPTVREILAEAGIFFEHPCGGRSVCGRCAIRIRGAVSGMSSREQAAGHRLSCMTKVYGDAEVFLDAVPDMAILTDEIGKIRVQKNGQVFAAADIGTTTIAVSLYSGTDPVPFFSAGAENPQRRVADDVLGRISYVRDHGGESLQRDLTDTLQNLVLLSGESEGITQWVVTGNTTMLYLLTGRDPAVLGQAPFLPDCSFDENITILGKTAYLPPCIHGFIGADLACAVLASGICERTETAMLCDLGTNGELALWKHRTLYVTSVAMGPALEGVGIRNGCGARNGAIDRVMLTGSGFTVHTIGGKPAIGLCGSGVIDAVACGLERGLIKADGQMEEPMMLVEGIGLYPEDVQSVLLAKAALNAGMSMLMKASGTDAGEIRKVLLCGGFGSRINLIHAAGVGLIPKSFPGITEETGNAAIRGAAMLREEKNKEKIRDIASRAKVVSLGGNPEFNRRFIENLRF